MATQQENAGKVDKFLDRWAPKWTEEFKGPKRKGPRGGGRGGKGKVSKVGDFEYDKMEYGQYGGPVMQSQEYKHRQLDPTLLSKAFDPGGKFKGPQEAAFTEEFIAPTGEEAASSPGYEFRRREGQRAIENAASAKGMLRTGNTWKDLLKYGQDYATAEYDKTYGRARSEHDLSYGKAQDRYGRAQGEHQMGFQQGAQTWQMNQQRALDQYDRAFQQQQANETNRIAAQQMGEMSEMGAMEANMGRHQMNFGIASGAWDRNYMGNQQQYDYRLQRARDEARMAEGAASRRESAYNADYRRAQQEYGMRYDIAKRDEKDRYDRWQDQTKYATT